MKEIRLKNWKKDDSLDCLLFLHCDAENQYLTIVLIVSNALP